MTAILTKRLKIREARETDVDGLFPVYSDPEAMAYWDTLPDTSESQTASRIQGLLKQSRPHPYRVIEHDSRAIGTIGVHSGDELGFILGQEYWRQGLMSEALTTYIPWAFQAFNLPKMTAEADPRNTGSLNILTKFGFVETGRAERTLQIGETWVDSVYLERPRDA